MNIYVTHSGTVLGPYTEAQVRDYLNSGTFTEQTLACPVGLTEWNPLSEVLGVCSGMTHERTASSEETPATKRLVCVPTVSAIDDDTVKRWLRAGSILAAVLSVGGIALGCEEWIRNRDGNIALMGAALTIVSILAWTGILLAKKRRNPMWAVAFLCAVGVTNIFFFIVGVGLAVSTLQYTRRMRDLNRNGEQRMDNNSNNSQQEFKIIIAKLTAIHVVLCIIGLVLTVVMWGYFAKIDKALSDIVYNTAPLRTLR